MRVAAARCGEGTVPAVSPATVRCPECGCSPWRLELLHPRILSWRTLALGACLLGLGFVSWRFERAAARDGRRAFMPATGWIVAVRWTESPEPLDALGFSTHASSKGWGHRPVALWDWQRRWLSEALVDSIDAPRTSPEGRAERLVVLGEHLFASGRAGSRAARTPRTDALLRRLAADRSDPGSDRALRVLAGLADNPLADPIVRAALNDQSLGPMRRELAFMAVSSALRKAATPVQVSGVEELVIEWSNGTSADRLLALATMIRHRSTWLRFASWDARAQALLADDDPQVALTAAQAITICSSIPADIAAAIEHVRQVGPMADPDAAATVMDLIANPRLDDNLRLALACAGVDHVDPAVQEAVLHRTALLLSTVNPAWLRVAAPELRDMVQRMGIEPRTSLSLRRDDLLWQLEHAVAAQRSTPPPIANAP